MSFIFNYLPCDCNVSALFSCPLEPLWHILFIFQLNSHHQLRRCWEKTFLAQLHSCSALGVIFPSVVFFLQRAFAWERTYLSFALSFLCRVHSTEMHCSLVECIAAPALSLWEIMLLQILHFSAHASAFLQACVFILYADLMIPANRQFECAMEMFWR